MTAMSRMATESIIVRGARSSATYAVVSVVQRLVPFLLLPIYASVLTPDEYGQIAVVVAVAGLMSTLFGLGLEPAVVRTSVRLGKHPDELNRFVNSVGVFSIVFSIAAAIVLATIVSSVRTNFLGAAPALVALGVLTAGLQAPASAFIGAYLRSRERVRDYASLSLISAVATAALTVFAVVVLRAGPMGWVLAATAASLVSLLVGLRLLDHRWSLDVRLQLVTGALAFSLPLLPHGIAHWTLGLSDRLILAVASGPTEAGIYNLAYQVAAPIGIVLVAINQGVSPLYAEASRSQRTGRALARLATYQVHISVLLGVAGAVLGPSIVRILFPPAYHDAGSLVGWLAGGYLLYGLYLVPANRVSMTLGATRWLWVASVLAAIVNVVLNLVAVERYGALAAAINTSISYGVLLVGVLVYRWRLRGSDFSFEWRRAIAGSSVLIAAGVVGTVIDFSWSEWATLLARALVLVAATTILAGLHRWLWNGPSEALRLV